MDKRDLQYFTFKLTQRHVRFGGILLLDTTGQTAGLCRVTRSVLYVHKDLVITETRLAVISSIWLLRYEGIS